MGEGERNGVVGVIYWREKQRNETYDIVKREETQTIITESHSYVILTERTVPDHDKKRLKKVREIVVLSNFRDIRLVH